MQTLRCDRVYRDLSLQPEQFYYHAMLKQFDNDGSYPIDHKIWSTTINSVSDKLVTLNNIELKLAGNDMNEGDEIVEIRYLNHVLNIIFKDMAENFERQNKELVTRIDHLTSIPSMMSFWTSVLELFSKNSSET